MDDFQDEVWGTGLAVGVILVVYGLFHWIIKPTEVLDRKASVVKNFVIFAYNAYLFYQMRKIINSLNYNWWCQPLDYGQDPVVRLLTQHFIWIKCLELLDTVIHTLRGNDGMPATIGHHVLTAVLAFLAFLFVPSGTTIIIEAIMCGFHAIIYANLVGTAYFEFLDANFQTSQKWLHLAQFGCILIVCTTAMTRIAYCGFPSAALFPVFVSVIFFGTLYLV